MYVFMLLIFTIPISVDVAGSSMLKLLAIVVTTSVFKKKLVLIAVDEGHCVSEW